MPPPAVEPWAHLAFLHAEVRALDGGACRDKASGGEAYGKGPPLDEEGLGWKLRATTVGAL